jgi:hypothetical protein
MAEWKIKRGDEEFSAADLETLKKWAKQGRVKPEDYVLNPVLEEWMYARDAAELEGIFSKQKDKSSASQLNRVSWLLGLLGLLMLVVFPPAGVVLLIIAVVTSAIYHVMR